MFFLKINFLVISALAALSQGFVLPWQSGPVLQTMVVALLAIHAIKTLLAFKPVKTYPGPLATSVVLSLLLGLLQGLPMARHARHARHAAQAALATKG